MSYKFYFWIVGLILLLVALFAYNKPAESATLHSGARTAASTLPAMVTPPGTATPLPALTIVISPSTPTGAPIVTPTSAYSVPMLTLREATNCRAGPGLAYEILVTYPIGQTLDIVGRYEFGNFWLVKSDQSPTGNCWLWGEFADVSGSSSTVTLVTPPPSTVAAPPLAPSMQKFEYDCNDINGTLSFWVAWEDRSGNEEGYRIFRDGGLAAELPAGSTYYAESIVMPPNRTAQYSIQAYNEVGTATDTVKPVTCDL